MAAASDLEPITLRILRRTPLEPLLFLVGSAALWIGVLASSGQLRIWLLRLAIPAAFCAVILMIAMLYTWLGGEERRWLRLDDEGLTLYGDRIPWEAVMSAQWRSDAIKTRVRRPGIVLRLRPVDGYEPPRSASRSIDPTIYGIAGIELLDLIVRYAKPHTVYILPPRHGPFFGRSLREIVRVLVFPQ